ncbi:hypothetical protein Rhe02_14830 [Rhizocola hellebori]|uniref:Uncharacterized protein n=1 Tax=Rhizocola hellebori TaxID=1392758 RepID=A0A8J3VEL1_9ACTN|nr:hypothetical protein Rhe02_14830 [Rhizocola hellebori]
MLADIDAASPAIAERLRQYEVLLDLDKAVPAEPMPADPGGALAAAVEQLASALGFAQSVEQAIRDAGIPSELAGRMARLLDKMHECHVITARRHDELIELLPKLFSRTSAVPNIDFSDVVACAPKMWLATRELERAIKAEQSGSGQCGQTGARAVDLWPVLRFEPGCANQTYQHDYLLIVDMGGDDVYANNAGSNVIDVNFSPPNAAKPGLVGTGPAKGCQRGLAGLYRKDCSVSAVVLLDTQGNDSYGVLEQPDSDRICTDDPVVRRMLTGGAAFLGVGILRDSANSADRYVGKTVSLGAAHMFGVGILSDAGGNDTYMAVRNSMGFSLIGGLGLLRDEGGDDVYDYYMPRPLNPSAPNQTDGAGGVRDNEGDGVCDRVPRYTLGGGNMATASGLLVDDAGDDTYRAAFSDVYTTNPAIGGMSLSAGSLGFGGNGAVGTFLDRGGNDRYQVDNPFPGLAVRADAKVVKPGSPSTDSPGARLFEGGSGVFIDR